MSKKSSALSIQVSGLNKCFKQIAVLKNIHLRAETGETLVLLGPSGCGKSTLLRCLNGLELPNSGDVLVAGIPVKASYKHLQVLRRKVGMVFQQFNLFPHLSILDNIALGPKEVCGLAKKEAIALASYYLNEVGLSEKSQQYPRQLSGGQQQRVAIARALAMEPKVLLLDEPTSALDPLMSQDVLNLIQSLSHKGMTLVMVTHQWHFAKAIADRVLFLHEGELLEDCPSTEFFNHPQSQQAQAFLDCLKLS